MKRFRLLQGKMREHDEGGFVRVEDVAALEAIVAKLPKTADGVLVYHDQQVWVRWANRITQGKVIEVRRDGVLVLWCVGNRPRFFLLSEVYSTPEAAKEPDDETI